MDVVNMLTCELSGIRLRMPDLGRSYVETPL